MCHNKRTFQFTTKLKFLRAYEIRQQQTSLISTKLEEFSGLWDTNGYNDTSITDDLITDILTGEWCSQSIDEHKLTQCNSDACLSLDNTFKLAAKVTVVEHGDSSHSKLMKGGILSVINKSSEILAWVRTFFPPLDQKVLSIDAEILSECIPRRVRKSPRGYQVML